MTNSFPFSVCAGLARKHLNPDDHLQSITGGHAALTSTVIAAMQLNSLGLRANYFYFFIAGAD
jgi:hypothetical protein